MNFVMTLLLSLPSFVLSCQSALGLWAISEVVVGEDTLTPIAKWIQINADLSYESGNGWTKNDQGRIDFDTLKQTIKPNSAIGLRDPFDDFDISFSDSKMFWTRMEEGMEVKVSFVKITEIPPGPADLVLGAWKEVSEHGHVKNSLLYLRPDRHFLKQLKDGSQIRGYWQMHAHRPELTLIPVDKTIENYSYMVQFKSGVFTLLENKEKGQTLTLERVRSLND